MKRFGLALAVILRFSAGSSPATGATLLDEGDREIPDTRAATPAGWIDIAPSDARSPERIDIRFIGTAGQAGDFVAPITGPRFESASPSPEPATWATTLAGFALLGAMLRAQRQARGFA
jgi:hypothetical protein